MTATLNDDPATLKAILSWGKKQKMKDHDSQMQVLEDNPILLASLDGYTECMKHLYKAGYRIMLLDGDWRIVKTALEQAKIGVEIHYSPTKVKGKARIKREGWETDDPVKRYLRFKAYANPDYLSMELLHNKEKATKKLKSIDPLRRSFVLGAHAKLLAEYFPEHSDEYIQISLNCQTYARSILGHCNNADDVKMLLEYSPREHGDSDTEDSNWHIALWEEHKNFVSHPYYQHYTWNQVKGFNFDPYKYHMAVRFLMPPVAILLFCLYPFIVLVDSLFREGNILFEPPNQSASGGKHNEHVFWRYFRKQLHLPIYRMCVGAFLEAFFLIVLYQAMTRTRTFYGHTNFGWSDFLTWTFIAHFLFEDIMDIIRHKWTFVSSFWSLYTFTINLLLVVGGLISIVGEETTDERERAGLSGNNPINVGLTLVAYGATMYCLRTVRWFLLNRSIGPVVVCTIRVIKDVFFVFAVFLVIYLSFGLGIWFMYKPFTQRGGSEEVTVPNMDGTNGTHKICNTTYCFGDSTVKDNKGMRGVLSQMFWRVFDGDASSAWVQPKEEFNNGTSVFSLEFSHLMGLSLWAMYQGITVVLLINILIALMHSTYVKVWENVDAEWKYSKSYFQVCKLNISDNKYNL
jgi:hypothetical protein